MNQDEKLKKFIFIDKKFESISGKENKENLIKWGMRGKLKTFTYTFDKQFHVGSKDSFILEFFQDEHVISSIKKLGQNGEWEPLNVKAGKVNVEEVNCNFLSVEIFDRIIEKEVARENGYIKKCLDEYYEDILISDELRKMLLLEESDNYEIFNDKERSEFLFRLFKHLCIGGHVCQFEDTVQPYIDTTRSIYKDLISVQKDSTTKKLKIVSYVYKVDVFDDNKKKIYPNNTVIEQDFCYLIVDPFKRHIIVLYHKYDGAFFLD